MKKIKNILTILITCLIAVNGIAQTQVLKVYSGGAVLMEKNVDDMDSIKSANGYLILYYSNGSQSFMLNSIDSIGFAFVNNGTSDSTAIDTTGCVRITWSDTTVAVRNPYSSQGLSINVSGGDVTAVSQCDIADIVYLLEGTSSDGSFKLTTDRKFIILLDGVNLTNDNGAAIKILSDYRGIVHTASGTVNTLCDGTASGDKGALQSKGRFVFQGSGTLNVSGLAKHGIQSSGSTTIISGNINVLTAVKDGMNVDNFIMSGGTVNVTSLGDGVDGDQGYIFISGGTLTITCNSDDVKGLGCDSTLTISGGTVNITVNGDQSKGIKTKENLIISGGNITVNANGTVVMEALGSGYEPSYCTGLKASGYMYMVGGTVTVTCPSTNDGGKAISTDGDIIIYGGSLNLTAAGSCQKYLDETGVYDSYSSTCLKSDGNITINGGIHTLAAQGRAISCDGNFYLNGGNTTLSTNGTGFTTIGSGTSCTDGFAPACIKSDGHIVITAGTLIATSTGKGGRGLVADSTFTLGTLGAADSLINIQIFTSGAPVNAAGGGWGGQSSDYWKGLPKGLKIDGNITINSGHLSVYCSQTSGDPNGEAIESKDSIFINGGYIEANSYDDAINAANYIEINGGHIWAWARGNDAIDCNGNSIYLNGGTVVAYGSECALDDNSDHGGHLYITGGTLVAIGGNMGAIEGTPTLSNQKGLRLNISSGGWGGGGTSIATNGFCIKNSDGDDVLVFKSPAVSGNGFQNAIASPHKGGPKPPGGNSSRVYVSSPDIQAGTYTYYTSPNVSGGTHWHGLYSGASVTTSGNGTNVTAQ